MTKKVALVHALNANSRMTNQDFTLAFIRHAPEHEWTSINALGPIGSEFLDQQFDLVLVTYEFLALRESPHWSAILNHVAPVLKLARKVALLPQDDYTRSAKLEEMIGKFDVEHIFTPVQFDLEKIYPRSIAVGRKITTVLTGYFEPKHVEEWAFARRPFSERKIDLGQRVRWLPPYFGPGANEKAALALRFAMAADAAGLSCDVSTHENAALLGLDWIRFLGNTKFTVGHLGGATVVDPKGQLRRRYECLTHIAPKLAAPSVDKAIPIKRSRMGNFRMISPRLFEAPTMGVAQVMPEGDYQIGIRPWEHYLPLAPDMSNAESILAAMGDPGLGESIAGRCLQHIQQNRELTYASFSSMVLSKLDVTPALDTTVTHEALDPATPFVLMDRDWPSLLPQVQAEVRNAWARGRTKFLSESLRSSSRLWSRELLQPHLFERNDLREVLATWMMGVNAGDLPLLGVYRPWLPASWFLKSDELLG
jgi:hypothetical protein